MKKLDIRNPRSGRKDYVIEVTDAAELESVASRMREAQPGWRDLGPNGRASVLREFAAALGRRASALKGALEADTGRTKIAHAEVDGLVASIGRWCAVAESLTAAGERPSAAFPDVTLAERRVPFPLVGAIGPWNFPLILSFIDAVPALVAGCAVIVKPSEVTPRFAQPVRAAIRDVPALDAVLAFVDGDGSTGAALIDVVDAIAFTGSVATGRKVAMAAAERFIPAFLELGGKDPAIVLEGADLERAATAILRASVNATGQACQSLERIYVHRSLLEAFTTRLAEKAGATGLSHPDPRQGIVGPLIFGKQASVIAEHLEDAYGKGASALAGGEVRELDGGFYVEPTVLTNVDHGMRVMTEETFGPIMPVMAFDTTDEAVRLANDSVYGLSAAVFGPDESSAVAVAERIDAGGISINDAGLTSFIFEAEKSAFRCSGLGPSRMGSSGLTRFYRQKALYLNRGEVIPIEAFAES